MGSFLESGAFCVEEGEGILNKTLKTMKHYKGLRRFQRVSEGLRRFQRERIKHVMKTITITLTITKE